MSTSFNRVATLSVLRPYVPYTRSLYLAGRTTSYWGALQLRWRADGRPSTPCLSVIPSCSGKRICPGSWEATQGLDIKTRSRAAGSSMRLEATGRPGTKRLPIRDRHDQPQAGPCALVLFTSHRLHHRAHSTLGGCCRWGLRMQEALVCGFGSRCRTVASSLWRGRRG